MTQERSLAAPGTAGRGLPRDRAPGANRTPTLGHHTLPREQGPGSCWDSRASLLEHPALPAALIQPPHTPPPPPGPLPLLPLFVIPLSSRLFSALLQLLTAIIQGTDAPADCSVPLPAADRGFNDSPGRAGAGPHLHRLPASPQHPSSPKHLLHLQGRVRSARHLQLRGGSAGVCSPCSQALSPSKDPQDSLAAPAPQGSPAPWARRVQPRAPMQQPEGLQDDSTGAYALGTGKGQVQLSVSQTMLLRASGHGALQRQGQDREQARTRQELGLCLQVHPRQHPPAPGTGTSTLPGQSQGRTCPGGSPPQ